MKTAGGIPIKQYNTIHQWVGRHFIKTGVCVACKEEKRTHWSNKDHKYSKLTQDWQELCARCHRDYDMNVIGVKMGRPKSLVGDLRRELRHTGIKWGTLQQVELRIKTYAWYKG